MKTITEKINDDGYAIINNCINKKLLGKINKSINEKLKEIIKKSGQKPISNNLTKNFLKLKKQINQYEIQKMLSKHLFEKNFIDEIFKQDKLQSNLIHLIGPDLSYMSDFEMAINEKSLKNDDYYFVKKYHQEFWSGMGLEALQLWIPLNLKKGMGTIEIIKSSHKWGHVPNRNREPIELPTNYKEIKLSISNGSVAVLSALTLHRTIKNNHNEIRVALPITVKNFYYPNMGNSDLNHFKKVNFSVFSNLRKVLGNPNLTPYRIFHPTKTKKI
tara:strand:- start:523 stop:1341 length:819 start_codon:yes stop_codon:yes gene_type:complete